MALQPVQLVMHRAAVQKAWVCPTVLIMGHMSIRLPLRGTTLTRTLYFNLCLMFKISQALLYSADGAAASTKSVPKTVLAVIIAVSSLGFIALLLIIIFVVRRIHKRRAQMALAEPHEHEHSPTFLQNPDLEAGAMEKGAQSLQRSRSSRRFTMRSIASMWSQTSFHGHPHDIEAPPPVPAVPAGLPTLIVPVPRSEHTMSISSERTGTTTLRSLDGFDDDKHEFGVANDDGHNYRESIGSNSTATVSDSTNCHCGALPS